MACPGSQGPAAPLTWPVTSFSALSKGPGPRSLGLSQLHFPRRWQGWDPPGQGCPLTIFHQDLDLISKGQGAQLGHGQDIAGGHGFVSIENQRQGLGGRGRLAGGKGQWGKASGPSTHFSSSWLGGISIMRYSLLGERTGQQLAGLCPCPTPAPNQVVSKPAPQSPTRPPGPLQRTMDPSTSPHCVTEGATVSRQDP